MKVEVAVLGSPSLIVTHMVFEDVKRQTLISNPPPWTSVPASNSSEITRR